MKSIHSQRSKKDKKSYPSDRQPEPWEHLLRSVTKNHDSREILLDPFLMLNLFENETVEELANHRSDVVIDEESQKQIEIIRRIAYRKLSGVTRQCLLLLLNSNANFRQIADWLQLSDDTVRRHIQSAVEIIRSCLEQKNGAFPKLEGRRPVIRATIFPLDTLEEQTQFQCFLNQRKIVYVSFRGDDLFREALVVYRMKKAGVKRKHAASTQPETVAK
ncbi:MAG: hypothetical protein C4527_26985 [Candidatus Omnitrophota bacterium]|nr:MAG: hypothetical protein C4527_26985 [Candidatus Omnitrophota bacterium]